MSKVSNKKTVQAMPFNSQSGFTSSENSLELRFLRGLTLFLATLILVCSSFELYGQENEEAIKALEGLSGSQLIQLYKSSLEAKVATQQVTAQAATLGTENAAKLTGLTQVEQESVLRTLLSKEDLYHPFAGALNAATAFAYGGTSIVPSAKSGTESQFRGVIDFESEHFGWSSDKSSDFSIGGSLGYKPTMTLVDVVSDSGPLPPSARPLFVQGFNWDLTPRVNIHIGQHGETSILGRLGQSIIDSQVISFKEADKTLTATVVNNGTGKAEYFWETGAEYRMYSTTLDQAHTEKTPFLLPEFSVALGLRYDHRFKRAGELGNYHSPAERFFLRALVNIVAIARRKPDGTAEDPFSVNFGIDYDVSVHDSRVPPATRLIISSSIDILKILKGQT